MADRKIRRRSGRQRTASPDRKRGTGVRASYQGEPGANSHLACLEVFPTASRSRAPPSRMRWRRSEPRRPLRNDPDRELGGRAGGGHPSPAAQGGPVHRRRALPACAPPPDGAAGCIADHRQARAQSHPGARPVPHDPAQARPDAGAGGRHGGLGPHRLESEDLEPGGHRFGAGGHRIRPQHPDARHRGRGDNTTRFIVLSADQHKAQPGDGPIVTTFIFRVRNVPAALYKAIGGFATNGINMTKLEILPGRRFPATMFYADIEGHPVEPGGQARLRRAAFFSNEPRILGVYKASPLRRAGQAERRRPHQGSHELTWTCAGYGPRLINPCRSSRRGDW